MRLDNRIINFLKQIIEEKVPGATIYLFGSRTKDNGLGGDIDLMIITNEPVDKKIFRLIRVEFYKKFGWQKIDFVNFTDKDQSAFRRLIQSDSIAL